MSASVGQGVFKPNRFQVREKRGPENFCWGAPPPRPPVLEFRLSCRTLTLAPLLRLFENSTDLSSARRAGFNDAHIADEKNFLRFAQIFEIFPLSGPNRRGQVATFDPPYLSPHPTPYNSETGYGLSAARAFQRCTLRIIS